MFMYSQISSYVQKATSSLSAGIGVVILMMCMLDLKIIVTINRYYTHEIENDWEKYT